MSYTVEMLNTIRNEASEEYQARIPEATQDNIILVGQAIVNYIPAFNEFTQTLVNKIGLTVISSKMLENRLAKFKKGLMPYGATIEEIFVEIAKAETFDPTGADALKRYTPDVKVLYHTENRQDVYPISISQEQVHKAFMSETGLQNLLAGIVNSAYSADNYDEFLLTKNALAMYGAEVNGEETVNNYFDYEVNEITNETTAKQFVKTVRKAIMDISFASNLYNSAGVTTFTKPEDAVLLVNKDVVAEVDVEVLAKAFNIGKTDFQADIIVLDDFGTMGNTYGVLIDKDFPMIYDTLLTAESIRNPAGLFTNHFLHHHQVLSLSKFKNAIRFVVPESEE